jgi:hypothetical protein
MENPSYEFELYRLRLEKPRQQQLFDEYPDRSVVINDAVISKPAVELKQTVKWHIGNVETSNEGWLYFFVGKTSLRKTEHFDEESRDFKNTLGEHSPFTYVILNPQTGVLGIAKRSKLANKTQTTASRLERILNSSIKVLESNYTAVIKPISDTHGFRQKVLAAREVRRFTFWVSPSNPIDIDGRFHQPNKDFVDASGAQEGTVSIKGRELDKQIVLTTANSVNSVGDDATASILQGSSRKPITVSIKGNPSKVSITEDQIVEKQAEKLIEETYRANNNIEDNQ